MPGNLSTNEIPYRLVGGGHPTLACTPDGFIVAAPQSEDTHCACLEFNGAGDSARLPGDQDIGIANEWSVMLWCLPTQLDPPDEETLFEFHKISSAVDNSNSFRIDLGPASGGTLTFRLFNNAGTLIKRFDIDSIESGLPGVDGWFFGQEWTQIFCTWDGADMKVYRNGFNMTPFMTLTTNIGGFQSNVDRSISIGSKVEQADFFTGFMHSAAYWSEALSEDAIRQIWNQGSGSTFNLNIGVEDYDDPRTLEGWWQLGKDLDSPVRDTSDNGRNLAPFVVEETLPTGVILPFGSDTPPAGFLLCDGSAVSRATFAALFAVIGENYGVGDGATTFNLPDMQGRFPQGKDSGILDFDTLGETGGEKDVTMEADQLPIHRHILAGRGGGDDGNTLNFNGPTSGDGGGAFAQRVDPTGGNVQQNVGDDNATISPNDSHNNMGPYQIVNYIIQT